MDILGTLVCMINTIVTYIIKCDSLLQFYVSTTQPIDMKLCTLVVRGSENDECDDMIMYNHP